MINSLEFKAKVKQALIEIPKEYQNKIQEGSESGETLALLTLEKTDIQLKFVQRKSILC